MQDVKVAKEMLIKEGFTCVFCRGGRVHGTYLRGVKPLVSWCEKGEDFASYSAADKVVGKATAFLYRLLKVKAVYAEVISKVALQILEKGNIAVEYGVLVENIRNRRGDGVCPFEEAVLAIEDEKEAYLAIRRKMEELGIAG